MVCENMYQDVNTTIVNIANCGTDAIFNGNFEFMALVALAVLALLAFRFKIPFHFSLPLAWATVYSFDLISGGSQFLRLMLVLLSFGIGVVILRGLWSYVERNS